MLYGVTVSTSDSESGSGGSNPFGATAFRIMPYGITVAQQVLALLAKVRLLLGRRYTAPWCNGSIPDFGSGGGGSSPSGAGYMEFVAEWFRRKFVALVYAGSNPVKLPSWSVHLNGQDYRFSICPHEFDPRTDYEMLQ